MSTSSNRTSISPSPSLSSSPSPSLSLPQSQEETPLQSFMSPSETVREPLLSELEPSPLPLSSIRQSPQIQPSSSISPPAGNPISRPSNTPISTQSQPSLSTSSDTPISTSSETSLSTSYDTPSETSLSTSFDTPISTPSETLNTSEIQSPTMELSNNEQSQETNYENAQIQEPSNNLLYDQSREPNEEYTQPELSQNQEPSNNILYDQPQEEQQPLQQPLQQPQEEPIQENQQITPEEYQQLDEKEKSIRSRILNQPQPCQKKPENPDDPFVEKVQLRTPLTQNEIFISNLIKTHPFAYLYFQPLIETHPLSIGTISQEDCENPEIQTANQNELIEGKYKNTGDKTLTDFLIEQSPQDLIKLLVHSHLQLLDSIAILQSLEPPVVHFHITPQTILYDTLNGTPVITDFRLAFTQTTLQTPEESDELFPPYDYNPSWPIEVFLLSQMFSPYENQFQSPTNIPIATHILTSLKNKDKSQLKDTYKSWDIYAINQLIYSFMTQTNLPLDIPFLRTYKELLITELTIDPIERSTIPSLQSKIKDIFKAVPKKEYLDFLSHQT